MCSKPEVLAPVGNFNMLEAAVRSGADAVYLGSQDFNARRNAQNFTDSQLQEAIKYCHIRGVKVYLTLNIVLSDKELSLALVTAENAYRYGIDGVICADLGLVRCLRQKFPDLPLHASTQMTVTSPDALPLLQKLGISRVVLPREMSAEQIKEFCLAAKPLGIETEVFVHGALCMSVSGQCLLSAMLGGRSGNRGLCAGTCRLPFSADNTEGYDLSLKDLCLLDFLNRLTQYGVTSFKIEGRMKRAEYVAAATAAVRQAVDTGKTDDELLSCLKNVFSRSGFTDGYLTKNTGTDMFGVRTAEDALLAKEVFPIIHSLYRNERQSIPLTAVLTVKKHQNISLSLSDGTNTVSAITEPPEIAINRPITKDVLLQNLQKLGGTPYYLKSAEIILYDGLAVAAKVINNLRRECVEKLTRLRATPNAVRVNSFSVTNNALIDKRKPKIFCRFDNAQQIPHDLSGVSFISIPLDSEITDLELPDGVVKVVEVPRTVGNSTISTRLTAFKKAGFTHAMCSTLSDFLIAKQLGFKIIGGTGLNIFNQQSAAFLFENGAELLTLSPEMLLKNAVQVGKNTGIVAYGNIPLMLAANCPLKNKRTCKECDKKGFITDRLGVKFPVRCRMGLSEILNSRPIWLADKMNELHFDFIMLYFTDETGKDTRSVINAYNQGLAPNGEYTRGLYLRGVE